MMKCYKAPWSPLLIAVSAAVTTLCLGLALFMFSSNRGLPPWAGCLPLAIVVCTAPFAILGYEVTGDAILVHRLFWTTRLPLAGLKSAEFKPDAMRRSLRTFGNGGLFSITGLYSNRLLGSYRAFVTDEHRTVVLRFLKRTVVVSPDEPEEFIRELPLANSTDLTAGRA